jgi:hypothetical protein
MDVIVMTAPRREQQPFDFPLCEPPSKKELRDYPMQRFAIQLKFQAEILAV